MSDNLLRQTFRVYDPVSLREVGQKLRVNVHSEGDWHLALTAFIFRENKDLEIEVLVQERSQYVDIAQKHFDQSLATQLVIDDNSSVDHALTRGLFEELGISKSDVISKFQWNNIGDIFISKQYLDNPELWNREIVVNYCVQIDPKVVIENNFKVKGTEWLPWSEFCDLVRMQPNNFTKSVRMYAVADSVASELNNVMRELIGGKKPKTFSKKMYYLSLFDTDVVVVDDPNELVEIYKTNYTMRKIGNDGDLTGEHVKRVLFEDVRDKRKILFS